MRLSSPGRRARAVRVENSDPGKQRGAGGRQDGGTLPHLAEGPPTQSPLPGQRLVPCKRSALSPEGRPLQSRSHGDSGSSGVTDRQTDRHGQQPAGESPLVRCRRARPPLRVAFVPLPPAVLILATTQRGARVLRPLSGAPGVSVLWEGSPPDSQAGARTAPGATMSW